MLYLRDCYPKFDSLMYSELAFLVCVVKNLHDIGFKIIF